MSTPPPGPLLTVRAAVVLLTAVVVGLVAGGPERGEVVVRHI